MAVSLQPIGGSGIFSADDFASSLGVGHGGTSGGMNPAAFGYVPAPVNPQASQSNAISGNLSNLSNLYSLATGAGAASGAGGASNLNAALPGATAALGSELSLGQSNLAGNIDPGTIKNLEQIAAERGVATGSIGSPDATAALMQLLGRTTQQTEALGGQQISSAVGQAPVGPQFNPNSMLINPSQQLEQENYNSSLRAAPNPAAAAQTNMAALAGGRAAGAGSGSFSLPGTPGGSSSSGYGGTQFGTFAGIGGGGGNMNNGAAAYQQAYGQQLPPGTSYDQTTGLVVDHANGTSTDPNTGLVFDAYTGEVISDTGGGQYGAGGSGYTPAPDDQGEYGYFEG